MNKRTTLLSILTILIAGLFSLCFSQSEENIFVYVDLLPDAPEIAGRGDYYVGVQTIDLIHNYQIDILNYGKDLDSLYSRPLKVEVWYPAEITDEDEELVTYEDVMGNANSPDIPIIPFTFLGRASRDAHPERNGGPYPLIIVSHGYTGSRLLLHI